MLLKMCTIFAVVITTAYSSMYHDRVVHVHQYKGIDNETCLNGYQSWTNVFCQSLEFIASKVGKSSQNVTIILESQVFLTNQVTFENSEFLTIKGKSMSNKINCKCSKGDSRGLLFIHVHHLLLYNTGITHCCLTANIYHASVLLYKCSNITVERVKLHDNFNSSAIVFVNPYGTVSISTSEFMYNGHGGLVANTTSLAGGIHMQFSERMFTSVTIFNCKFRGNRTPAYNILSRAIESRTDWNGHSLGGGMGIALLKGTTGLTIYIKNSTFHGNSANWGGGLCVYLQKHVFNNSVLVVNSTFISNTAKVGGGGVQVRLGELNEGLENYVLFQEVRFVENFATFGGGVSVNALFVRDITKPGEILQFCNCTWYSNSGQYSPAVDLSPSRFQQSNQGYLPILLFKDSFFKRNHVRYPRNDKQYHVTQGVFIVTRFFVYFQGYLLFEENWYSGLYLTSGRAIFDKNSNVMFHSNNAINGGAIAIYGFSALIVNDNSTFQFINNSAARVGGGIYYASTDQREYFEGRTCFLEYGGNEKNVTKRDIFFTFHDNKAPLGGLSIYSESLFSCYFAYYERYTGNLTSLFDGIGTFHFDVQSFDAAPLATAARNVFFEGVSPVMVIPGNTISLPLAMYDEFHNIMHSEFALRVEGNKTVHLDNYFTVNNSTRVYGASNQTVKLVLSTPQTLYGIEFPIQVTLLPCSPGFFYDELAKSCKCSADYESYKYPAITKCANFRAFIKNNYWVGYYPSNNRTSDHLYTAFYPSRFDNYAGFQVIPNNSKHLSDFMCGTTREGVLCGKCKAGYSAYYHSREITCGKNRGCNFGMLFYLLSEIIPTVAFFTIVVIIGVNFSAGSFNGFVFFSQVVDAYSQDLALSQVEHSKTSFKVLQSGHQLIYGIFNFDYFSTIPFCLWKGATIMDVMVFKYITTTFAFALIILIAILMNYSTKRCSGTCILKVCRWRNSSVTHGISTVLIICYGQCTRAGFFILTKAYLRGKPGVEPIPVTYYGGLPYFGNEHLPYAIPAIVITFVLVGLPPFCLILYPLILHLLELCGLSEHNVVNKTSHFLGLNRFMPLFDSFQSCYKDKMRFIAGLYFLYRVVAFLVYMYGDSIPPVFVIVPILVIHSILQPYKSQKHNVVDALMFLNLAIINSLTIVIKFSLIKESTENVLYLELIQLAFIYLPFLCFVLIISINLVKKVCSKFKTLRDGDTCEVSNPSESVSQVKITHSSVELSQLLPLDLESDTYYEYS